jgi:hypothetical protein
MARKSVKKTLQEAGFTIGSFQGENVDVILVGGFIVNVNYSRKNIIETVRSALTAKKFECSEASPNDPYDFYVS